MTTAAPSPGPEQLFAARLAADPAGPLVTFYDDATGERAELSAKSLGNWVAKTHFLLLDELGLAPGDRAFGAAAGALAGRSPSCWGAGSRAWRWSSDPAGASVAFGDADSLLAALPGTAAERLDGAFAVSLLRMARPSTPPPGMADYASSVRPMPDAWPEVRAQAGPDDPALAGLSRAELAGRPGRRPTGWAWHRRPAAVERAVDRAAGLDRRAAGAAGGRRLGGAGAPIRTRRRPTARAAAERVSISH